MEAEEQRQEARKWIEHLVRRDLPGDDWELEWAETGAGHELAVRQNGVQIGPSVRITDDELQGCLTDAGLKHTVFRRILVWVFEVDGFLD